MTFSLQFAAQFVWGLVIIAAFIGWGGVIRRLVHSKEGTDADWGLLAGWGMAGVIFIGGILNLLHLARPGPVIVVVAIGAVAALWENRGRRPALPALSILGILGIAVIGLPS